MPGKSIRWSRLACLPGQPNPDVQVIVYSRADAESPRSPEHGAACGQTRLARSSPRWRHPGHVEPSGVDTRGHISPGRRRRDTELVAGIRDIGRRAIDDPDSRRDRCRSIGRRAAAAMNPAAEEAPQSRGAVVRRPSTLSLRPGARRALPRTCPGTQTPGQDRSCRRSRSRRHWSTAGSWAARSPGRSFPSRSR
jgi:hypothetical protein